MEQRFALGLVALALSACGITARSDDFRCEGAVDCPEGRSCVDGWCVTGQGDGAPDSDGAGSTPDGAPGDAALCPSACDSCPHGTCMISCEGSGACPELVVCPPGMPCDVRCAGSSTCDSGIDCSAATGCEITCNDTGSCAGPISCGPGRCDIECNGAASCTGGIDCSGSCRCDTDCDGIGSCLFDPSCPFSECVQGEECTDVGAECRNCQ